MKAINTRKAIREIRLRRADADAWISLRPEERNRRTTRLR
jgi:hypothetical protein